eukprot:2352559-Rhodomonas_salina.1
MKECYGMEVCTPSPPPPPPSPPPLPRSPPPPQLHPEQSVSWRVEQPSRCVCSTFMPKFGPLVVRHVGSRSNRHVTQYAQSRALTTCAADRQVALRQEGCRARAEAHQAGRFSLQRYQTRHKSLRQPLFWHELSSSSVRQMRIANWVVASQAARFRFALPRPLI